jgi:hypothetical protein
MQGVRVGSYRASLGKCDDDVLRVVASPAALLRFREHLRHEESMPSHYTFHALIAVSARPSGSRGSALQVAVAAPGLSPMGAIKTAV